MYMDHTRDARGRALSSVANLVSKFNASIEIREPTELLVEGRIPPAIAGTLYRTGPGHYQIPDTPRGTFKMSHWFGRFR